MRPVTGGRRWWGWSANILGNCWTKFRAKRHVYRLVRYFMIGILAELISRNAWKRNFKSVGKQYISCIQSSYCVPFNSLVPCHLFFPRESTHLFAVLTWHFFSDGLKAPRSSSSINRDVDHIQVRFHVKERCFFIQKAILNILDESDIMNCVTIRNVTVPKIYGFHYTHEVADFFSQETGMPCSNNIFTIQTYLSWRAIRLLEGFSKRIVPPAQIVKTMRITLLSFCEWPMGNSCKAW